MEAAVGRGSVGGVRRGRDGDLVRLEPRVDERIAVGSGLRGHRRRKRQFCLVLVKLDLEENEK